MGKEKENTGRSLLRSPDAVRRDLPYMPEKKGRRTGDPSACRENGAVETDAPGRAG